MKRHFYIVKYLLSPIIGLTFLLQLSYGQKVDRYAEIGGRVYQTRDHLLQEVKPIALEDKYFPVSHDKSAQFEATKHDYSDAALQKELEQMRVKYEPYMRKLAPTMDTYRVRKDLNEFAWRVETAKNRADFISVLEGRGDWEEVQIPHYEPPLG